MVDCGGEGLPPPRIIASGSDQLLALDSIVYKTTHGLLVSNHGAQLRHKHLNILHTVGVITTTVEGDGHFTIIHIRDVFDGAGRKSELRHNEFKMNKWKVKCFERDASPPLVVLRLSDPWQHVKGCVPVQKVGRMGRLP